MLCLSCQKNNAIHHQAFGWLECSSCRVKNSKKQIVEIIPEYIKTDRKAHKDDTIQPFRKGILSKEYITKYGTGRISVTPQEVKNAKNVWEVDEYYG